ncbi:MAG TPA: glycosyltransferase [Candidatus Paceibacterota bacterium]|nr:glycosyltransferase [Candidatus Paceibacterota bacterium]HMO82749.1 glycosyltransferase [Candidatus Paceibacterota bacterium]
MNYHFNYIITIHNKQDLIKEVLLGVIKSCREDSVIYPVLDGCTDDTEKIIDALAEEYKNIKIVKIYAPDVHEIKSLNIALRSIPQTENVLNITLQDDVILQDSNLEKNIITLYDQFGFENVGTVTFRHGATILLNNKLKQIEETDVTESVYGVGMTNQPIPSYSVVEKMVSVRSPECISSHVINTVGYFDEELAPYTWDNHDLSIRCLKNGLRNFVFAVPFISDVNWGGMRKNPHPELARVMKRNKEILYFKHKEFIEKFSQTIQFDALRIAKPFYLKNLPLSLAKDLKLALNIYQNRRKQMLSNPYQRFFIDKIKKNLRSIIYLLISVKIYFRKLINN